MQLSRGVHCKKSLMDQRGIEELLRGQELSRLIHLAIERCQDCDKNQLKSTTDKPSVGDLSRLL